MSQIKLLHSGGNGVILSAPNSNPSSDINFKLPQADGSNGQFMKTDGSGNLAFAATPVGGITEIDYWRLTSNFQGTAYHIQNNWERADSQLEDKKGTGMSESSGLFTFPSTGYWYVEFNLTGYRGAGSTIYNITQYIRTTTSGNTSSGTDYNLSNNTSMYSPANNSHYTQSARMIVKCSNTSNDKVFFGVQAEQYIYIQGNTNESFTYAVFIKLADI
mgnify:CR=1 FL=1